MTIWQALGLGVLQGATEFLPVSSSGHLALAEYWLGTSALETDALLFDVVVHVATLLAIAIMLRTRILALARAGLSFLPGARGLCTEAGDRHLALLILIGSVPTALIGLAMRDFVEHAHARPPLVGLALWATAALLLIAEWREQGARGTGEMRYSDALLVGTLQGLAVMPGVSRSGATIATALVRDVRGDAAVEFSLLLSIPAIVGASLLVAIGSGAQLAEVDPAPLAVGFAAALATGALALRALQWVVTRRRLRPFAIYCAALGTGAILLG